MQSTRSHKAEIRQLGNQATDEAVRLNCSGDWTIDGLKAAAETLENFVGTLRNISIQWDISDVGNVDSAGMMLFIRSYDALKANNCSIELIGTSSEQEEMYHLLRRYAPEASGAKPAFSSRFLRPLRNIGKNSVLFISNVRLRTCM